MIINELKPGEYFKAFVTDIKPGQVTIRLDSGVLYTARTRILPEARIGEESLFSVRENNLKGQIALEMVKPDVNAKQMRMLREALTHAGLLVNDENLQLGKTLLTHNLPVDAGTLHRAAFFAYTQPDMTMEKVVFLLKEDMPADVKTVQLLTKILKDPQLLHYMLKPLKDNRLYLPLEGGTLSQGEGTVSPLHKYYNNLLNHLNEKSEHTEEIKEVLRFMERIHHHREYYQIPFIAEPHGQARQAELFIFKDGRGERNLKRNASVLISLDTFSLGKVEVFTLKSGNSADFRFRANTEALKIIRGHTSKLTEGLQEKGVRTASISYEKLEKVFTLLNPPPAAPENGQESQKQDRVPQRFMFDMRV